VKYEDDTPIEKYSPVEQSKRGKEEVRKKTVKGKKQLPKLDIESSHGRPYKCSRNAWHTRIWYTWNT